MMRDRAGSEATCYYSVRAVVSSDKTVEMSNSGQKNVPNCIVKRQRIMFMGKELKDTQKLDDLKIDETKIVQVFLRPE